MDDGDPPCDPPFLRPGPYLGEISALSVIHLRSQISPTPLLLTGTGSELLVYNLDTGTLLYSFRVFNGVRIHGISVRSPADPMIAVFGEKNVKLFYLRADAESLQVRLEFVNQLPRFEHWVMDAKFLNEDGYLALGLSDNSVALWDVPGLTMMGRLKSAERCLLYSMRIWGESLETLRLASGTIYNEVIVWRFTREDLHAAVISLESINECIVYDEAQNGYKQVLPVHFSRLTGHEGSIFRIGWSTDGSRLVSVSDDRSARIWMFSSDENLGTQASDNLVLFGHTARIWDCHISDSFIITAGEDCTCRVWDFDGNLLLMFKEHIGRGIWRCLYDQSSSLLVTAGFDSAIKVYRVCLPSVSKVTKDDMLLNDRKNSKKILTIAAPQSTGHVGLMNSKSEYIRCLRFAQENILYVATNNGFLYHVDLSNPENIRWTKLAQVSKGSPIICMDLMSMKSWNSSSSKEFFIAIGDGLGNATVMKLIDGKSTSIVVLSLTWAAEKERQLLGIYWCKSLGCSHLFTVAPRGLLKLWKINYFLTSDNDNKTKPKVSFIAEFTSYFGARIMCLDASARDEILVCGDQRGNLTVYPFLEGLMNADSVETVEKIHIKNWFKGAHGISTVSNIMITTLDFNQVEIRTTGGDGCICYFKYDKNLQLLEFIGMKQVKELSTVQSVYTSFSSDIESMKDEYAIGFTSAEFIIWNLANETKMLEIPCGGWRRPYSYHLGAVPEYQFCFAYVKDLNINIHRLWVPTEEKQQCTRVLHLQYHGREIHTLCFISFPWRKILAQNWDSLIATGCEDGTVRLTRCMPLRLESWCESKLLGEHIGGSAVRSICFVSKTYLIGAGQTHITRNDALDFSKTEPLLLISVGAKQVLTSWMLRCRAADVAEKSLNAKKSENMFWSSDSKYHSISFQWLSTHTPPKCAKPQKRVEKSPKASRHGNAFVNVSDTKPETFIDEHGGQNSNFASLDIHENDWRYLDVTAFMVKLVDSRFTTCFVVVACSDATLSLRALLLPFRLWYDVAVLVPQLSPVLTLKHVAVPFCTSANGDNSTRVAHIVISGSTDGSISFWDLTEMVEDFMQAVSEYKPQLHIDCQRRPQTGRGSQGGRSWRYLTNQPSDQRTSDDYMSKDKLGNGTDSGSSESIVPKSPCSQKIYTMNTGLDPSSPDEQSMTSPLARKEVTPLLVLDSVHQSGVNCLHVSEMKNSDGKSSRLYCVVSGGDDQALHYLAFQFGTPIMKSDSSCGYATDFAEHMQDINHCQPSGSSFTERHSYNIMNNGHRLRVLQRQCVKSAHSSSVKGIWTNGNWVFSTGLDQRVRCWKIGVHGKLVERAHLIISVPEPESLDVIVSDRKRYQIAVAGRGIQTIDFFPPDEEC